LSLSVSFPPKYFPTQPVGRPRGPAADFSRGPLCRADGIVVDIDPGMKDVYPASPLIRWQFARGERHLTCAVNAAAIDSAYEVATVPLWDVTHAAVETFDSPREALHRHAAIAADLREAGWTLSAYTS
jgi:hypothetical protein